MRLHNFLTKQKVKKVCQSNDGCSAQQTVNNNEKPIKINKNDKNILKGKKTIKKVI